MDATIIWSRRRSQEVVHVGVKGSISALKGMRLITWNRLEPRSGSRRPCDVDRMSNWRQRCSRQRRKLLRSGLNSELLRLVLPNSK